MPSGFERVRFVVLLPIELKIALTLKSIKISKPTLKIMKFSTQGNWYLLDAMVNSDFLIDV